jgi:hypothetical protein
LATRATAGLYDSCFDVLFDVGDDDFEVLIRWHRIPFISKIISGFTCIVDRTGCGISSFALPSSDDDGDSIAFETVVALSINDVPVRTSVLIIVDSFHCCLHCSNFRRFFSFRDNLNSAFAAEALSLSLSLFSTEQLVSAELIILTAPVDSIRSMICKAHRSNLHG